MIVEDSKCPGSVAQCTSWFMTGQGQQPAVLCGGEGGICCPSGTAKMQGKSRASQGPSWGAISTEGKTNASHQAPISTNMIREATSPAGC